MFLVTVNLCFSLPVCGGQADAYSRAFCLEMDRFRQAGTPGLE